MNKKIKCKSNGGLCLFRCNLLKLKIFIFIGKIYPYGRWKNFYMHIKCDYGGFEIAEVKFIVFAILHDYIIMDSELL